MQRRYLLKAMLTGAFCAPLIARAAGISGNAVVAASTKPAPIIDVYKSASCGCCGAWVEHLEKNGFTVRAHDVANPAAYRAKYGIPNDLGSCHTGVVQGYALEGHVPANEIKRMLAERPKAKGLAVPAMPLGSPGMEAQRNDSYDVILVQADGQRSVYRHYSGDAATLKK